MKAEQITLRAIAGNDGPEAQDWAQTLYAMYLAWARREELGILISHGHAGRTLVLTGAGATRLRTEAGMHRYVRRSRFDSHHRRHTTFAGVSIDGDCPQVQIRSYILHPYTAVHDHRTGYKVKDAYRVLRGNINGFLRAVEAAS